MTLEVDSICDTPKHNLKKMQTVLDLPALSGRSKIQLGDLTPSHRLENSTLPAESPQQNR